MKPVLRKNYGSIGHLPGSRLGPGDHMIQAGQAAILVEKVRDYKDLIIVQEKLDGANVGILRHEGKLVTLTRKGHRCIDSPLEQFQMFDCWVQKRAHLFDFIDEGERLVGEWLAMAHGTRYDLDEPFVAFDLMRGDVRLPFFDFMSRIGGSLKTAALLHAGGAISIKKVQKLLDVQKEDTYGYHGALDPAEGAVWRVEREGKVDFLGKWVRGDKEDGKYFNEDHTKLVWNWRPHE